MNNCGVIRDSVDGKNKYARIPVRRKSPMYDLDFSSEENALSAEIIMDMPRDQAIRTIDAILADWAYWLKRAGELWCLYEGAKMDGGAEDG